MQQLLSELSVLLVLLSNSITNAPVAEKINLEPLIQCESGGRETIKIVDSNGYYSYGILQFQLGTFRKYGEKYGIIEKGLSNNDLRQLIFRADLQRAIATKMLQDGEWWHWKNCAIKNGYHK